MNVPTSRRLKCDSDILFLLFCCSVTASVVNKDEYKWSNERILTHLFPDSSSLTTDQRRWTRCLKRVLFEFRENQSCTPHKTSYYHSALQITEFESRSSPFVGNRQHEWHCSRSNRSNCASCELSEMTRESKRKWRVLALRWSFTILKHMQFWRAVSH